jgi:hypothetical protein
MSIAVEKLWDKKPSLYRNPDSHPYIIMKRESKLLMHMLRSVYTYL